MSRDLTPEQSRAVDKLAYEYKHDVRLPSSAPPPPSSARTLPPGRHLAPTITWDQHLARTGTRAKHIAAIYAALVAIGGGIAAAIWRVMILLTTIAQLQTQHTLDAAALKATNELLATEAARTDKLEERAKVLDAQVGELQKAVKATTARPGETRVKQLKVVAPEESGTFIQADGGVRRSPFEVRQ